jgi:hypothetical protein
MTDSLLATSDTAKVAAMKAEFRADRDRNQPRRAAIAKSVTVCVPLTWWRIYAETFAEVILPTGKRT